MLLPCGAIAQLGERVVRNDEAVGSIPTSSTISTPHEFRFHKPGFHPAFLAGLVRLS